MCAPLARMHMCTTELVGSNGIFLKKLQTALGVSSQSGPAKELVKLYRKVKWPGDEQKDWCDATSGALTFAAEVFMCAVFARFDADRDGALCPAELNELSVAIDGRDLQAGDLRYLLDTFETTACGGCLTARGLSDYFLSGLGKADCFECTRAELAALNLHRKP